jgi:hypothetical protein
MTYLQRFILIRMLNGHNISGSGKYGYRLRSAEQLVVRKFYSKTFQDIKKYLRKHNDVWLINKNKIRQMHGRSLVKQHYTGTRIVEKKVREAVHE